MITTDDIFVEFVTFIKNNKLADVYKEYGGMNVYVPSYKSQKRDADIVSDYNEIKTDTNQVSVVVLRLARKYNLTPSRIYHITREVRIG